MHTLSNYSLIDLEERGPKMATDEALVIRKAVGSQIHRKLTESVTENLHISNTR